MQGHDPVPNEKERNSVSVFPFCNTDAYHEDPVPKLCPTSSYARPDSLACHLAKSSSTPCLRDISLYSWAILSAFSVGSYTETSWWDILPPTEDELCLSVPYPGTTTHQGYSLAVSLQSWVMGIPVQPEAKWPPVYHSKFKLLHKMFWEDGNIFQMLFEKNWVAMFS